MKALGWILGGMGVAAVMLGFLAGPAFAQQTFEPKINVLWGQAAHGGPGGDCSLSPSQVPDCQGGPYPSPGVPLAFNVNWGDPFVQCTGTLDFGDGQTANISGRQAIIGIGGGGMSVLHTYAGRGTYSVAVTLQCATSSSDLCSSFTAYCGGSGSASYNLPVGVSGTSGGSSSTRSPLNLSSTDKKLIGLAGLAAGAISLTALTGGFRRKPISFVHAVTGEIRFSKPEQGGAVQLDSDTEAPRLLRQQQQRHHEQHHHTTNPCEKERIALEQAGQLCRARSQAIVTRFGQVQGHLMTQGTEYSQEAGKSIGEALAALATLWAAGEGDVAVWADVPDAGYEVSDVVEVAIHNLEGYWDLHEGKGEIQALNRQLRAAQASVKALTRQYKLCRQMHGL